MISIALAEEERHSERLKDVLDTTSDRLEYEVQRADEATARAEYAEVRAKDCFTKLSLTESARDTAERELSRSREDEARYRVQVVELQAALKRLQDDFAQLRDQKMEAEVKAERASEAAREAQTALLSSQAMEAGRQEGFQVGMLKQLNEEKDQMCDEAYADGYEDGKHAGFAAGVKAGRKEGLRDGREQGRREERQNSLRAFDKFVNEEMDEADSDGTVCTCPQCIMSKSHTQDLMQRSEWTRRWAESVYHQTTPRRSPGPALFRP